MNKQNINHSNNRRNFLKNSILGAGAFAGLPALDLPLFGADLGSRIKTVELLVLKQNREQRRVLKVISSTGNAGYADFPDCLLYTSPSPRDNTTSRMPSSA